VKIVAIKPAFYNGRRVRVGQEFEIPSGLKGSWFAPVTSAEAVAAAEAEVARPAFDESAGAAHRPGDQDRGGPAAG
jgi:hypothetical protein